MSVADNNDPAAEKRMENGAVLATGNHGAGFQALSFLRARLMQFLKAQQTS